MAGKRLKHPALKGLRIGQENIMKDRRPTLEQNKEKQRLKKAEEETQKGAVMWQSMRVRALAMTYTFSRKKRPLTMWQSLDLEKSLKVLTLRHTSEHKPLTV